MGLNLKKITQVAAPIVGAVGGGLITGSPMGALVGGQVGSAVGLGLGQQQANETNLQTAREQMAFQERMSSTAHQREVKDLEAAGLNPVLSANSGASTPVGASPDIQNAAPDYSKAIESAYRGMQMKKDFEQIDAQIGLVEAQKENQRRQAEVAANSAKVSEAEARIRNADAVEAEQSSEFLKRNPRYIDIKKAMDLLNPIIGSARDVGLTYRSLKGFDFPKEDSDYKEKMREKKDYQNWPNDLRKWGE